MFSLNTPKTSLVTSSDSERSIEDLLMKEAQGSSELEAFSCWICKENFTFKQDLFSHRKIHFQINIDLTEEDGNDTYFTCNYCIKTFSTKVSMAQHYKVVHCSPTFQCHLCPQRYSTKQHLSKHVKSHAINVEPVKFAKKTKGKGETAKKSKKVSK